MANALRNRFVVSGTRKWKTKFHRLKALALSALVCRYNLSPLRRSSQRKSPG